MMEIRIKESVVKEREEIEEVYTPETIRRLWSDDTAESSLVLALLEKWEHAEQRLAAVTKARDEACDLADRLWRDYAKDKNQLAQVTSLRKVGEP